MDQDQQRDFAEEAYWRAFCPECGTSPCAVDGEHYDDGKSALDLAAEADILQDCPSLTADQAFEIADLIEAVMGKPENSGKTWTASVLARSIRVRAAEQGHGNAAYAIPETHKVGQVLIWMVRKGYAQCDDRGAWTHYWGSI